MTNGDSLRPHPLRIIYPVSEGIDYRRARFHQILQTAHALARQGCAVDLLLGRNKIEASSEALTYYGLGEEKNLRIHQIPLLRNEANRWLRISWSGLFHWACFLNVRKLIRQRGKTIVFMRHLNLARFFLRFKNRLPARYVFEAHEIFHLTTERKEKAGRMQSQEARVYAALDGLVAITRGLADQLRRIFPISAPLEVIPDGVNLDFFKAWPGRRQSKKIFYVGQLYPWKGVEVLVEAMLHLPGRELHLVGGDGAQMEKLRRKVRQLGLEERVTFHGHVSPGQVRDLLAEAAVAVLPSTRDLISTYFTSPLKLFEYMAAQVPIVASDLPSLQEVLQNEVNALLVPPNDPAALAGGIQKVLQEKEMAVRLAHKAHEDVGAYSWEERAKRLIRFFQGLRGGR